MAIGSTIGGGLGFLASGFNPMGAALGSALGGTIEGVVKERKAKNINLPLTDPLQVSILNDLMAKKRQLETGTAYRAQQDAITNMGRTAMSNALKVGGGNVGATMSALSNIGRGTQRSLGELYGTMGLEALKLQQLIGQQANDIAQRRLDIPYVEKNQIFGDSQQVQKDALSVLNNVLARSGKLEGFGSGFLSGLKGAGTNQSIGSGFLSGLASSIPINSVSDKYNGWQQIVNDAYARKQYVGVGGKMPIDFVDPLMFNTSPIVSPLATSLQQFK